MGSTLQQLAAAPTLDEQLLCSAVQAARREVRLCAPNPHNAATDLALLLHGPLLEAQTCASEVGARVSTSRQTWQTSFKGVSSNQSEA